MRTVNDRISYQVTSMRGFYFTYIILLVLLALTGAVYFIDLGIWNTPLAFLIAIIKTFFVLWIFMNVRSSQKLVLLLFGSAIVLLLIGTVLTMSDYETRKQTVVILHSAHREKK